MRATRIALVALTAMVVFAGCGDEEKTVNVPIITPPDAHKADPVIRNDLPHQHASEVVVVDPFTTLLDELCSVSFPGFKQVEMDPMDGVPLLKKAKKTEFRRLRHIAPTRTPNGGNTYPRILIKAYQFANFEDLKANVEEWFEGMEHSGPAFTLGAPLDALKTPPLLCLATDNTFVMVMSTCSYHNEDWKTSQAAFFEFAKAQGAKHAFEATCQAGKLRHEIGGM